MRKIYKVASRNNNANKKRIGANMIGFTIMRKKEIELAIKLKDENIPSKDKQKIWFEQTRMDKSTLYRYWAFLRGDAQSTGLPQKTAKNLDNCYFCGLKENLHIHHLSYKPEITTALCFSCHMKWHSLLKIVLKHKDGGLLKQDIIEQI